MVLPPTLIIIIIPLSYKQLWLIHNRLYNKDFITVFDMCMNILLKS